MSLPAPCAYIGPDSLVVICACGGTRAYDAPCGKAPTEPPPPPESTQPTLDDPDDLPR